MHDVVVGIQVLAVFASALLLDRRVAKLEKKLARRFDSIESAFHEK